MNRIPKAVYTKEFREEAVKLAQTEGVRQERPPNQRLKLSGAAILVFRASTSLQAAPAA